MLCARCGSELPEGMTVCAVCDGIPDDRLTFPEPLSPTPTQEASRPRRRILLTAILAILVAAAAVAFYVVKNCGGTAELGIFITLEAQNVARQLVTAEKLEQCVEAIEERLSELGIDSFEVKVEGDNAIVIGLPTGTDVERVMTALQRAALFGFYRVSELGSPYATAEAALSVAGVESEEALPTSQELVFWPEEESGEADRYYLVTDEPTVAGNMVKDAGLSQDRSGHWEVDIAFTDEGAEAFAEITGELATTGSITGEPQRLVIVLDGVVESAPTVMEQIEGGSSAITGQFTYKEAQSLVHVLEIGGTLMLELTRVE